MKSSWFAPPVTAGAASIDAWFTPGRFAAILSLLVVAMFPDVLLGQRTLFYRDFGIFGYPLAHYHRECFWRGEIPLWNPLNNFGLPFLAQWNTLTLYPLSLFYLLFPLSWSLGVFCLGHLFLGGMGMYLLAHRWTENRLAASVAGVAFAFNGLTWHALMWPNNIAALGWMPFVVLATERAWREGRRNLALAALAGVLQMLAGAPEIAFLTWAFLASLCLSEIWRVKPLRFSASWPICRRFAFVVLLVGGLSAAQLLPFLDLLQHSQRSSDFGDMDWAMPRWGWANFMVPLFHTYRSFHGVFVQYGQHWTCSYYAGVTVVAFAIVALWRLRQPRVWLLAALTLLTLVLALGDAGYLFGWLRRIFPQLGFMRFPIKFVTLTAFILPLLAAYTVAWYRSLPEFKQSRERRVLLTVGAVLGATILAIVFVARQFPLPKDDWPATWQNAVGRLAFLLTILGTLLLMPRLRAPGTHWAAALSLLALLWLDNLTHAPDLNPTAARSVFAPDLVREGSRFDPQPRHGISRVMVSPEALAKMRHLSVASPDDECIGRRLALYGNLNLLDDIPKLNGFYSLYLREADELNALLYFSSNRPPARLLDFLNVSHTTASESPLEWTRRDSSLPMVTAGQKPVFAQGPDILKALSDPQFDPHRVVYLPPEARSAVPVTNTTAARILSSRISAQYSELEVDAPEPSMLVLSQAHYHPWRAYVDGAATPIWRANHAFQAVVVPSGRHQVRLVYEDRQFALGASLSGATLLGCLLLLVRKGRPGVVRSKLWQEHEEMVQDALPITAR